MYENILCVSAYVVGDTQGQDSCILYSVSPHMGSPVVCLSMRVVTLVLLCPLLVLSAPQYRQRLGGRQRQGGVRGRGRGGGVRPGVRYKAVGRLACIPSYLDRTR